MLCSARELKLSDDHGGLLILDDDAPVGSDMRERARARRHDLHAQAHAQPRPRLSVYGVAREVAALTGAPLKTPTLRAGAGRRPDDVLPVTIEAPDLCGRFSGRVVRGVDTQRDDAGAGWSTASPAAASARSRRWSTSRTT